MPKDLFTTSALDADDLALALPPAQRGRGRSKQCAPGVAKAPAEREAASAKASRSLLLAVWRVLSAGLAGLGNDAGVRPGRDLRAMP
jgi:hypothetical protein